MADVSKQVSGDRHRSILSVAPDRREYPRPRRADPVDLWGPDEDRPTMDVSCGDDDFYGAVLDRAGSLALARAVVELWGFTAAEIFGSGQ